MHPCDQRKRVWINAAKAIKENPTLMADALLCIFGNDVQAGDQCKLGDKLSLFKNSVKSMDIVLFRHLVKNDLIKIDSKEQGNKWKLPPRSTMLTITNKGIDFIDSV